jgi:hypothetical protein
MRWLCDGVPKPPLKVELMQNLHGDEQPVVVIHKVIRQHEEHAL